MQRPFRFMIIVLAVSGLVSANAQELNDVARLIAGMKPDSLDAFPELRNTDEWKRYHKITESKWIRFNRNNLKKIRKFSKSELGGDKGTGTVFYPFSGPDFLYVNAFFPDARHYIFFGLEAVGRIPDPGAIPGDSLHVFFELLNRNLDNALSISFFKTKDMREEFKGKILQGTVPLLMYFIARTGNHILGMKPFRIGKKGTIVYADSFQVAEKGKYNDGVEMRFRKDPKGPVQTLIYFSLDISDYGLSKNASGKRFLQKLDSNLTTYIKAASYLMHKRYFLTIREMILEKSKRVLQDDSGIPYRLFDPEVWDLKLYGKYTQPIELFKEYFEEDLFSAYSRGANPLYFRLGYNPESNLLLALRKDVEKKLPSR